MAKESGPSADEDFKVERLRGMLRPSLLETEIRRMLHDMSILQRVLQTRPNEALRDLLSSSTSEEQRVERGNRKSESARGEKQVTTSSGKCKYRICKY